MIATAGFKKKTILNIKNNGMKIGIKIFKSIFRIRGNF